MSILRLDDKNTGGSEGNNLTDAQRLAEEKALASQISTLFIFSLISLLFCCIGGIIATYYANHAKQDMDIGNIEGARHNFNVALGWTIATYVLGGLSIVGKLSQMR